MDDGGHVTPIVIDDGGADIQAKAFSVEYISLIVIILSFVLTTFSRQFIPTNPVRFDGEVKSVPLARRIEMTPIRRLFNQGSAAVNSGRLEALAALLRSHDLTLEVELYSPPSEYPGVVQGNPLALSMARSVALSRYFARQGVPSDAVRIIARGKQSRFQGRQRLYLQERGTDGTS